MRFRPCIDLHAGQVKQIVGSSLADDNPAALQTNFQADHESDWYARLFRSDQLTGGHIIRLGPGNDDAARCALAAWPGGMQIGGGISIDNAPDWLAAGADAVIVTSWVFHDGQIDQQRLRRLSSLIGPRRLVLDLSCRRRDGDYFVVTNRWQTFTRAMITPTLLDDLAAYCHEFLIHGVDVEGQCGGIELDLMAILGRWQGIPITYAGGIRNLADIDAIDRLGNGRIDFTVGSALDIFGGSQLAYRDMALRYGRRRTQQF